MSRILAIGGAHIDRIGRLHAPHRAGASNPGSWDIAPGGGVFNLARNLARLGHSVTLISLRGGDEAGEMVARAAEEAGINDCPITFLDRATASYTAILEPDGNLVTALADMAIYDMISPRRLTTSRFRATVADCEMIVCDANLPAPALQTLGAIARETEKPLAAIAISPAKVIRFRQMLADLAMLFMNTAEAAALAGIPAPKPGDLRDCGLGGATVTAGPAPATFYLPGSEQTLAPPPLPKLADVTGAGDGLAAGVLDGWLRGLPSAAWLVRGIALARLSARVRGPVDPELTLDRLETEAARITGT